MNVWVTLPKFPEGTPNPQFFIYDKNGAGDLSLDYRCALNNPNGDYWTNDDILELIRSGDERFYIEGYITDDIKEKITNVWVESGTQVGNKEEGNCYFYFADPSSDPYAVESYNAVKKYNKICISYLAKRCDVYSFIMGGLSFWEYGGFDDEIDYTYMNKNSVIAINYSDCGMYYNSDAGVVSMDLGNFQKRTDEISFGGIYLGVMKLDSEFDFAFDYSEGLTSGDLSELREEWSSWSDYGLDGVVFEVYDSEGEKVDTITTKDGFGSSKILALDKDYIIKEVKTAAGYKNSGETYATSEKGQLAIVYNEKITLHLPIVGDVGVTGIYITGGCLVLLAGVILVIKLIKNKRNKQKTK